MLKDFEFGSFAATSYSGFVNNSCQLTLITTNVQDSFQFPFPRASLIVYITTRARRGRSTVTRDTQGIVMMMIPFAIRTAAAVNSVV